MMDREEAIDFLESRRAYYASLSTDPSPHVKATKVCGYTLAESANACLVAIKALEQEPCKDAVSRQAVQTRLKEIINEMETIFADIREWEVDDSVCGLCEYDCDHGLDGFANECPGFEKDDCFKLKDEYRKEWTNTEALPSVTPQPKTGHWINTDNYYQGWECSECGCHTIDTTPHFCPNCGAKMVETQESEDKE